MGAIKLTHVVKSARGTSLRTVIINVELSVLYSGHLHGVHGPLEVVVQLNVQELCKEAHTIL